MNRIIEGFRMDDERILDRLVDDELTEEDRKTLLAALDDEPGSWRRCALAFLEAQTWRGVLRKVHEEERPPAQTPPQVTLAPRPEKPSRFFELCLAMAACVVMAFGIGVWVRSMWSLPGSGEGGSFQIANDSRVPRTLVPQPVSQWHRARLNFDDPSTQGPDNIELPVREIENLTEDHLHQNRSALPEDVRRALERSGHRKIQRRQLVPIPLKDGRRLVVPVEQVDVEPNGRPAY